MSEENKEKSVSLWNKVLETSLRLPFVKVNREEFLTKELTKFCTPMEVMTALDDTPLKVLNKKEIDKLANQCINYHLTMVCGTSALMGLPGGWWMAGTIPTDLTQFYGHILSLMQKLIYLYGWPSLTNVNQQLDDESLNIMTLFVGVMMGNKLAVEALTKVVGQMSKNAGIKISEGIMAHYIIKIAQWTKEWERCYPWWAHLSLPQLLTIHSDPWRVGSRSTLTIFMTCATASFNA